jgi:hypothetical protein
VHKAQRATSPAPVTGFTPPRRTQHVPAGALVDRSLSLVSAPNHVQVHRVAHALAELTINQFKGSFGYSGTSPRIDFRLEWFTNLYSFNKVE